MVSPGGPTDCSPLGSAVHGFCARILKWGSLVTPVVFLTQGWNSCLLSLHWQYSSHSATWGIILNNMGLKAQIKRRIQKRNLALQDYSGKSPPKTLFTSDKPVPPYLHPMGYLHLKYCTACFYVSLFVHWLWPWGPPRIGKAGPCSDWTHPEFMLGWNCVCIMLS